MSLRVRAVVPALALALSGSVAPGAISAAVAQNAVMQQLDEIRDAAGFGKERAPLDFTERPPLVVPPTYNLPPPGTDTRAGLPVADPDVEARRKALTDPRRPVPPSDPGAAASGLESRRYLIDPPSGLRDPARVAADISLDNGPVERSAPAKHHRKKRTPAPAAEAAQ